MTIKHGNTHTGSCCDHDYHIGCGCHHPAVDLILKRGAALNYSVPAAGQSQKESAERDVIYVFYGGTIRPVTQGDASIIVDALAILNGKVLAVGDEDAVESEIGKVNSIRIKRIDLEGKTLTPGFVEPHVHVVPSALMFDWDGSILSFQDYTPFGHGDESQAQMLYPGYSLTWLMDTVGKDVARLAKEAPESEESYWLLGNGVDTSLMPDSHNDGKTLLDCINAADLDKLQSTAQPQFPILLLSASLHTGYVNTEALNRTWAHVEENKEKYSDFLAKYPTKEAFMATDGVLQEMLEITPAFNAVSKAQIVRLLEILGDNLSKFLNLAKSRGATMVYDAGMETSWWDAYQKHMENEDVRVGAAVLTPTVKDFKDSKLTQLPFTPPTESDIDCYIGSCKVISDGSNQGLTGFQNEPYSCPPVKNYGLFNYPIPEGTSEPTDLDGESNGFQVLIKTIHNGGWPIMVHANGDLAVSATIEAYEKAVTGSNSTLRHRIEHCSLLDAEGIATMKECKISPSFLIGHLGYWGYVFQNYIFEERAEHKLDLCKSSMGGAHDPKISLHSDCTVSPVGPLRCMEQAFTRKLEGYAMVEKPGEDVPYSEVPTLNPAERITAAEGLSIITYQSAWQCNVDELVGSLEPGKLADLVILAQDPVNLLPDQPFDIEKEREAAYLKMRNIKVEQVWIGGRLCE